MEKHISQEKTAIRRNTEVTRNPQSKPVGHMTNPKNFPPQIPGTSEGLKRAILLLGNRTKGELTDKPKRELVELIGAYPTSEQASLWKQNLKQLVKNKGDT